MKKEYLPYYISRALLSMGFSALVFGLTWKALLAAVILFALFLLYLHSGWFSIDLSHPLSPLRRDERAREIQRRSLIAAVGVGLAIYVLLPLAASWLTFTLPTGPLALSAGVLAYFAAQFILLARS
jgi:sterol desaturase/sphingolipid hydroxylase (fatty acid hydroxylase superfamily)